LHLLLLIAIVLTTTRTYLVALAGGARLGADHTQPMIPLVTSQHYRVHRIGPPSWRRAVARLPEHCKRVRARIGR
jgi:hypothetical protein